MTEVDLVWYASYGSNLSLERFMCYIKGGVPEGSQKNHEGCRDKRAPLDWLPLTIKRELYFSKRSHSWDNGGVAFVSPTLNDKEKTLSRMYLISGQQFIDIVRQETDSKELPDLDFEKIILQGSDVIKEDLWYGNQIYLGVHGDYPIFTFTNEEYLVPYNKPSSNYLAVIGRGLKETYAFNNEEIAEYLLPKNGIKDVYTRDEVLNILH